MKESISIGIPKKLLLRLNRETKTKGVSRSELITDLLEKYYVLQDFYRMREKMVPLAEAQGIFTDEDVFSRVS
ncbi:MAG: ribbon-helix-helix protein, CopG family [Bacteroidota bacterium]|nr:ribbon-helix-helix protein, CopG family [Bacteroidota bacterium]MDP4231704.1 ribbon-helix-helix protein, CopG family [Bacteroidota bacterium]MDP4237477.1 ribbon-helix-helix protein, CopG family [Bacteroidota bacterium]